MSPLLALIALHGLETAITSAFSQRDRPQVVVYADDFVVLHPTRAGVEKAQQIAEEWLSGMGLHLKASKTRIGHTLHALDGRAGFDFLGFSIRHYLTGKTRLGMTGRRKQATPLQDAHQTQCRGYQAASSGPSGGSAFTQSSVPKGAACETQSGHSWLDHVLPLGRSKAYLRNMRLPPDGDAHALGRPPPRTQKPGMGVSESTGAGTTSARGRLEFSTPDGLRLVHHADMPIRRHVKVRGRASPYDGNLVYWAQRLRDHPLTSSRVALLLKRQGGRCARCGLLFTDSDRDCIEVDHIIPRSRGGAHDPTNMQALHGHCHDEKTAEDGSQSKRQQSGIVDKNRVIEEPDESNGSCPVLKTSRSREGAA